MFLEKNRTRIEAGFAGLCGSLPEVMAETAEKISRCRRNVALALKYLYSTAAYSDLGNYGFPVFFDCASHAVTLWEAYGHVRDLPEELFLNYVLYHRVNEEELRACRSFFYEKIVRYLDPGSACLPEILPAKLAGEVNFWCASQVGYHSADARTASARAVCESGYGRCGEESVFLVNALRSVGIPARQVYAPFWAHCDDNHAWVELWTDGKWHFTGACEPYPRLDAGWFNGAASRAPIVHSRWFDFVPPRLETGDVIGREGMALLLNQTSRYADTVERLVRVEDEEGAPIPGAKVDFQVVNYARLSCVARMETGEDGCVRLRTGRASLLVTACMGRLRGERYLPAQEGKGLNGSEETQMLPAVVRLQEESSLYGTPGTSCSGRWEEWDMDVPSGQTPAEDPLPLKEKEVFDERLRRTREAHRVKTQRWCSPELERFAWHEPYGGLRQKLMDTLSEKDLTDADCEILEAHLREASRWRERWTEKLFLPYVLSPRIYDEVLTDWRTEILAFLPEQTQEELREHPERIGAWIRERITECPHKERSSIYTTPGAALRLGIASLDSQKILAVAIARSLGIPARWNRITGEPEYWTGDCFHPLWRGKAGAACLTLYVGIGETAGECGKNWTLTRERDGLAVCCGTAAEVGLEPENYRMQTDSSGDPGILQVKLESGNYRLLTTNRLPGGSQLVSCFRFALADGQHGKVTLRFREADPSQILSHYRIQDFAMEEAGKKTAGRLTASSLAGAYPALFLWLEEGSEPTEHILNELAGQAGKFAALLGNACFLVRSEEALSHPTLSRCLKQIPGIRVFVHGFGREARHIARCVYVEPNRWPLALILKNTPEGLESIFAAGGYNVGMGDMILRVLEIGREF